jgi:hypothetical protein
MFLAAAAVLSRESCECSFANIFAWREIYQTGFTRVRDRLIVLGRTIDSLLFPMGAWFDPMELEEVRLALSCALGTRLSWGDVPPEYLDAHHGRLAERYRISSDEGDADYVYLASDLAAVVGHRHQNTRRLLRQFEAAYPDARLLPLTAAHAADVLDLAAQVHDEQGHTGPSPEDLALKTALDHFDGLRLEGLRLVDGTGRMLAFSILSLPLPSMADVHFEKALRQVDGAAQAIRVGVARTLSDRVRWINLEQDLGLPGLRRSKQSYNPDHLVRRLRLDPLGDAS